MAASKVGWLGAKFHLHLPDGFRNDALKVPRQPRERLR